MFWIALVASVLVCQGGHAVRINHCLINTLYHLSNAFNSKEPYFTLTDIKIKDDSSYVNTTMKLAHNIPERQFALDMDITYFKIFPNLKMKISVEVLLKATQNRLHLVNQTIDVCSLLTHGGTNWHIKAMLGDLDKYPNIPRGCPIMPGHYFLKNFTINIKQIPLKIIPEVETFGVFEIFTVVKKRSVVISNIKIDSVVKYNDL